MAPKNILKATASKGTTAKNVGSTLPIAHVGPVTRSKVRAFAGKNVQKQSTDNSIFEYTNPTFDSASSNLATEKGVDAAIEATLSLLEAGSNSQYSREEDVESTASSTPLTNLMAKKPCYEDSTATSSAMPVMMADVSTVEEQLVTLTKLVEGLAKHSEQHDLAIAKLLNRLDSVGESSQAAEKRAENAEQATFSKQGDTPNDSEGVKSVGKKLQIVGEIEAAKEDPAIQVSSDGSIPISQLKDFIIGTIKNKYESGSKSSFTYVKPYTRRIDSMKMPTGYQPLKFQQFDGKGNPKQHIAHFVETCDNAGTDGDFMVKQFVRSLKGNAFD